MRFGIWMLVLAVAMAAGCRKSDFEVDEGPLVLTDYGQGTGTVTWKKGNHYLLKGLVFVNDGQVLTIEPGTVVRFSPGQGENASALVVARGGKIIARGTAAEPIIFTAENDDLNGSVAKAERGLWGGLVILGNAPLNIRGGEASVEGIPLTEPRAIFGGPNENDNSGVLEYVSIRHGGTNIGEGNEINGLTLGGVGRGTEIDYVEIISNEDDGVEVFGGTVNLRHLVVSGCGDDAFDYDLGWSGNGQFWLCVQSNYLGEHIVEAGGGVNPVNGLPFSLPQIFNATFIGNGATGTGYCVSFKDNAGGVIANSLFVNNLNGISLEATDLLHDSYYQWKTGNLAVANNLFFQVAGSTAASIFEMAGIYSETERSEWADSFPAAGNTIADPHVDWAAGKYLPAEKIKGNLRSFPSTWFQQVDFKGAFGDSNWMEGWTLLSQ